MEAEFKIGDIVIEMDDNTEWKIVKIQDGYYYMTEVDGRDHGWSPFDSVHKYYRKNNT